MRQGRDSTGGAGLLAHDGWAWRISATVLIAAYVLAIAAAEVLVLAVDARAGAIGHAAVLVVLLNHRLFARGLLERRPPARWPPDSLNPNGRSAPG